MKQTATLDFSALNAELDRVGRYTMEDLANLLNLSAPDIGDVHVNAPLTRIAIQHKEPDLVLDQVFPIVTVGKRSDKYFVWTKKDIWSHRAEEVAPGAPPPFGGFRISTDEYSCKTYKFGWRIPREIRMNMDPAVASEIRATQRVAGKVRLAREINIATALRNSSTWTSVDLDSGSANWNQSGVNPLTSLKTGMISVYNKTGLIPNVLVIGWHAFFTGLAHNAQLMDHIKYTGSSTMPAKVVIQTIMELLGIEKIIVTKALYTTSPDEASGDTATYTNVMGDDAWLGYVAPMPALDEPTAGMLIQWGQETVQSWYDADSDSDKYVATNRHVAKVTLPGSGYLLQNVIA